MITFLFLISFTLIIILFYLIVLIFQRLSKVSELEKKQIEVINEIENVLTGYILEIKEENEILLTKIQNSNQQIDNSQKNKSFYDKKNIETPKTVSNPISSLSIKENQLTDQDIRTLLPSYQDEINFETNTKTLINNSRVAHDSILQQETNTQSETTLNQAISLKKQGLTIEEIAKKLNKGKTEVELLLKFRQK